MRRPLAAAMALLLASCASDAEWRSADQSRASEEGNIPLGIPPPAPPTPQPLRLPEPPRISVPPVQVTAEGDTCGMTELRRLIGRPRTELPVPVDPARRRVVCTTCPMTFDLRPDRLTVLYDADTGRVTKLICQ